MIHAKKSLDNVWCGEGIFGKVTDAEGYKVTCPKCIERKPNVKKATNDFYTQV